MLNQGYDYTERIGAIDEGRTVLEHLRERYRHSSEYEWRARLEEGRVLVEGRPASADAPLLAGQTLIWKRPPWREPDAPLSWAVLYLDDALLGVAKPAGLPTLPGGGFLESTLLSLVRRRFPESAPLHRLDRGASGCVLFARVAAARDRMAEAFRRGEVVKEYRAIVAGEPREAEFVIEQPIGRVPHPRLGSVHAAAPAGSQGARAARTKVRVIERRGDRTLAAITMSTGRPHQIRIHLAAAGHPLIGDPLYVAGGVARQDGGLPGDPGYHLHATRVSLRHPISGGDRCIESPAVGILADSRR